MVFVTGGTGLVGSHLLFQLATKGDKVIALVRDKRRISVIEKVFSYYSDNPKLIETIEFIEGDILDPNLVNSVMQRAQYVYHCAAMVSFHPKDVKLMTQINVDGTKNIVNSALKNGVNKLCFVSSTAAIGKDPNGGFNTEETSWTSSRASNYSITKYNSEQEVWKGVKQGLSAVIVNPSIILGPGDWGKSSTSLFKEVWKGLGFYTTGSNAFVDVRDVADCMIKLMNSNISSERFLTISENISFEQLLKSIANSLGRKPPSIKATKMMTSLGWRIEKLKYYLTGKLPRITKESALSGQSHQLFSNKKINNAIQHKFISVEQSIQDTGKLFLKDITQ